MRGQRQAIQEEAEKNATPLRAHLLTQSRLGEVVNRYGLVVASVLLVLAFSLASPDIFLSRANFANILGTQAILVVMTMGLLVPLTVGEFDLSMAGLVSSCLMLTSELNVQLGWSIEWVVAAVFLMALFVGALNAVIVVGVGVNYLVVTLGLGALLMGASYGISGLSVIGISTALTSFARTKLFGVQMVFYYGLLITVIWWYVRRFTQLGRNMQFAGANPAVARLAGINVDSLRAGSFVASSLTAGVAALLLAGVLGSADPGAASGYLLPPFAAAFLGATAIDPGRFNPWGAFVAVYFLVTGIVGLQIIGFSGWIEQVFYGGALVRSCAGNASEISRSWRAASRP